MIDHPPAVIQILGDPGGTLGERMAVTQWLSRIGARVEILGTCASACLWFITLPQDRVCFAPGAWIGVHTHLGEPDDSIAWTRGARWIADGWARCR